MSDETISQPRIKITWLIGTLAAFGLFVVIGFYSKRMTRDYTDYDQQRAQERYATLAKEREDESKLIYPVDAQGHPTAEWVDQANGFIRIPIDEAMAKEIDTLKAKPTAAACEIPGVAPAPVPASTNAAPAAPAPPAKPAKPAKTTLVTPVEGNHAVFKTHAINTTVWVHEGEHIWVMGTLISSDPALAKLKP